MENRADNRQSELCMLSGFKCKLFDLIDKNPPSGMET
jgi:hypothetical protein